jgi:hypothetical protein
MYLLTATEGSAWNIPRFGSSRPRHEGKKLTLINPGFPSFLYWVSPTLRISCVLTHHLGSDPTTLVNPSRRHLSRHA